jgi:predicted TIM-barrel fold metal-dependent hydrolase
MEVMMAILLDDYHKRNVYEKKKQATFLPEPPAEELYCPLISVDDHLLEPLSVFQDRVPKRFADAVPQVDLDEDGCPWWIVDDQRIPLLLPNAGVGRPMSEWRPAPVRYDEMRDGVWNPAKRLEDMDLCGIWGSLCFGSIPWGFAGSRFSKMNDRDVGLAAMRAYNAWNIEEWCAADRERFIPCQYPWLADPVIAADEIRRNAELGFKAVSFSENPEPLGFPNIYDRSWDPFFAACEETETVVNLHVGSSGVSSVVCSGSPIDVQVAMFPVSAFMATVDWIYARIPLRFPRIKIALSEGGASWVPMAAERLRRAYRQVEHSVTWSASDPDPVEIMKRNFYFCSIDDPMAYRNIDAVGEDRLMAETDYPHYDSSWPKAQELIRSQCEGVLTFEQVRKVCYQNAALLYRVLSPPAELIARSVVGAAE